MHQRCCGRLFFPDDQKEHRKNSYQNEFPIVFGETNYKVKLIELDFKILNYNGARFAVFNVNNRKLTSQIQPGTINRFINSH